MREPIERKAVTFKIEVHTCSHLLSAEQTSKH